MSRCRVHVLKSLSISGFKSPTSCKFLALGDVSISKKLIVIIWLSLSHSTLLVCICHELWKVLFMISLRASTFWSAAWLVSVKVVQKSILHFFNFFGLCSFIFKLLQIALSSGRLNKFQTVFSSFLKIWEESSTFVETSLKWFDFWWFPIRVGPIVSWIKLISDIFRTHHSRRQITGFPFDSEFHGYIIDLIFQPIFYTPSIFLMGVHSIVLAISFPIATLTKRYWSILAWSFLNSLACVYNRPWNSYVSFILCWIFAIFKRSPIKFFFWKDSFFIRCSRVPSFLSRMKEWVLIFFLQFWSQNIISVVALTSVSVDINVTHFIASYKLI